jgi:hypothetical protein
MRSIIFLALAFASQNALAGTQSLIPASEDKGMIIVQGDSDGFNLYNSLDVEPVEESNILSKTVESKDFSLQCRTSNLTNVSSCTFNILKGDSSEISKSERLIKFYVGGKEAEELQNSFHKSNSEFIFESSDKLLLLKVDNSGFGVIHLNKNALALINPILKSPDQDLSDCLAEQIENQSAISLGESIVTMSGPFFKDGASENPDKTVAQFFMITDKPTLGNPRTSYSISFKAIDPTTWQLFGYGSGQIGMFANETSTMAEVHRSKDQSFEMSLDISHCASFIGNN